MFCKFYRRRRNGNKKLAQELLLGFLVELRAKWTKWCQVNQRLMDVKKFFQQGINSRFEHILPLFAILSLLLLVLLRLSPNLFIFVWSEGAIVWWWKSEIFGLPNKLCVFSMCCNSLFSELCNKHHFPPPQACCLAH